MVDYATLVQDLQDWAEDDDTEFVAAIPRIITLAHDRVVKDLDLGIYTANEAIPTVGAQSFIPRPSEVTAAMPIMEITGAFYVLSGRPVWLERRSPNYVLDHQSGATSGPPKYYAEYDEAQLELSPIPDTVYSINVQIALRPLPLSGTTTTTWVSVHAPDLLFSACLIEGEGFLKSDDRIDVWKTKYQELLPSAKKELYSLLRARYQLTPLEIPAQPTVQR